MARKLATFAFAGLLAAAGATLIHAQSGGGLWQGFPIINGGAYCSSTNNGVCTNTVAAGPSLASVLATAMLPVDTRLSGGQVQTALVPLALLQEGNTPRNALDNGAMAIQQRGTGTQTCGTTTIPATAYSADRWGCNANVTSGAGRAAVITSSPTPPAPFPAAVKLYRTSGALTQPICIMQEIPTVESTYLAGQTVTLSFWAAALAGLAADNNNAINAYIFTGTGADEGLQSFTASPAITPAWTGITSSITSSFVITTSFVRYSFTAVIPSTATELGVALCFTPTATGAGATDGFAFTGTQLEAAPSMSNFEFRKKTDELVRAQAFYWSITEGNTARAWGSGGSTTTGNARIRVPFPQTMFKVPTMAYTAGFDATGAAGTAYACSALASVSTSISVNSVTVDCTSTGNFTANQPSLLVEANGSGVITASADF